MKLMSLTKEEKQQLGKIDKQWRWGKPKVKCALMYFQWPDRNLSREFVAQLFERGWRFRESTEEEDGSFIMIFELRIRKDAGRAGFVNLAEKYSLDIARLKNLIIIDPL